MKILGISAFYHDSAAALVVDGQIVAAAQEERFSRRKHDADFPTQAVQACLREAGLAIEDLDYVAFYEKPLLKFERLVETYLAYAPRGFSSFREAIPVWAREKLFHPRLLDQGLKGRFKKRYLFPTHHESHAASAFYPSPFEEAAILTVDGVGEWTTTAIAEGQRNRLRMHRELRFPHSLGLLYSAFTYFLGFRVNGGEYKVMGLAPYGVPRFRERILEHLVDLRADGSFRLNLKYFGYCDGLRMTNRHFAALFGEERREPESPLQSFHFDLAASIQAVTEEIVLSLAREAHRVTGQKNLCLAGGVALNCVANGRILREGPFERIWVQPAAGDAGGALGAALFTTHQLLDLPRAPGTPDAQRGSRLGPAFDDDAIAALLKKKGLSARRFESHAERCEVVARHLAEGAVVGWFDGPMEYGPRALGGRSILGDPRSPSMQRTLNLKIKYRESFRPFAPSVLAERAVEYFDLEAPAESPYMLLTTAVRPEKRTASASDLAAVEGLDKLRIPASVIPAVTHVNYSARVQTVDAARSPHFHQLIAAFEAETGTPLVVNTSFNVRGEPIVHSPADALRCFARTEMDTLSIGSFLLEKAQLTDTQKAACDPAPTTTKSELPSWLQGVPINWDPSLKTLKQFGWICPLGFGLIALALTRVAGIPFQASGLPLLTGVLLGSVCALAGTFRPALLKPLYSGLSLLGFPIGWVVGNVLMLLLFGLLCVPLALWFRLIGRDELGRRYRPESESYWQNAAPARPAKDYFKQF